MEDIIAHARELGKKIAAHPRCAKFMDAVRAVAQDKEAQQLLRDYQDQTRKIQELEASGKPIEVADKRQLADFQARVASSEKLKVMLKHQADYLEMMNGINGAIDEATEVIMPKE
jgi:cell fate (sporulation/competence/biofilm development) regulator YlbF (YheA/YmcA/DUF963 family)